MFVWVAHITVLTVTTSRLIFFSYGRRLHPRRRGRSEALAVCTDGLLRATTSLALCAGMADRRGQVRGEKPGDGLRAGGCKCRADNTACSQSHTRQEEGREGGQRWLNTRLEENKKSCSWERKQTLLWGSFSFERSFKRTCFCFRFHVGFRWTMVRFPLACVCIPVLL